MFTSDGYLVGVCNFAEPKGDQGLYAAPNSIYRLLDRNNLSFLYMARMVVEKEIDDAIRDAERQLNEDDKEGVDRTMQQLNALIEARRKGLQDALRSLDTNYLRRRDELLRRASERRPETRREAVPKGGVPDVEVEFTPDSPIQSGADSRLDRVLDEWRRRSAAYTSLYVRFTGRWTNPRWGDDDPMTGRVVLTKGGRAFIVSCHEQTGDGLQ